MSSPLGEDKRGVSLFPLLLGEGQGGVSLDKLFLQQLKGMIPSISLESMQNPHHRQRLQIPRTFNAANIYHRPAEFLQDLSYLQLGRFIISADKHIRRSSWELG